MTLVEQPLTRLGWDQKREVGWPELIGRGVPPQLGNLAGGLSMRWGRPLHLDVMPTLSAGVVSLALPFRDDDSIIVERSLLDHPAELARAIATELAYMLYPGWRHPRLEEYGEMDQFATALSPMIQERLPTTLGEIDAMVDLTIGDLLAGAIAPPAPGTS